jgi:RimJ/RimL family protein N-acetyltransferase
VDKLEKTGALTLWFGGGTLELIRADRVLLRDFEQVDWQAVHGYASDPEVVRYMDWGPNTEDETKSFVKRSITVQQEEPRRDFVLAVVLERRLIGGCGIHISDPKNREGWIGYCLNRGFWGRGIGTETARALVAFGFDRLGLHRIFATCDPENVASARVLEKTGMQREGRLRERTWRKGRWLDCVLYAILDHE